MGTLCKRRIVRAKTSSSSASPRGFRQSSRLATKRAQTMNSCPTLLPHRDPFLAIGRRGNKCWCAWKAVHLASLDGLTVIDGAVPKKRKLYVDQEGFVAIRHSRRSRSWLEWLPVETGPLHTSKGRHSPLRIGEGRCTVLIHEELRSPELVAIADRMMSRTDESMWYLVLWSPCTIDETSLGHSNDARSRPIVIARLQDGRSVVQFTPSWISLHDFEPHEFSLLRYFYERSDEGILAIDEGKCAKLASLNLLQAGRAAPMALGTMGGGRDSEGTSHASGSTNWDSPSASR